MTKVEIAGLILLAVGAVITFASAKISAGWTHKRANLITKIIGLVIAVAGFVMIFI